MKVENKQVVFVSRLKSRAGGGAVIQTIRLLPGGTGDGRGV